MNIKDIQDKISAHIEKMESKPAQTMQEVDRNIAISIEYGQQLADEMKRIIEEELDVDYIPMEL